MSELTWLVIGLGNVGSRYVGTRHNVGFAVLDRLVGQEAPHSGSRKAWKHSESVTYHASRGKGARGATIVACWPTTLMNLSGDAAQELLGFYQIKHPQLVVIHDDIDLPCGKLRIRKGGGDGGQKGVRSIIERTGSADFIRIKVGVGRPPDPRFEVADWVLSKFAKEDSSLIETAIQSAVKSVCVVIESGLVEAQNQFNRDLA